MLEHTMIHVLNLSLTAGAFKLQDVTLEVPTGRYAVLMGRTGCGKTTLLETICGLRPIQGGRIVLRGRDVTDLKPAERNIGYVPQDRALFPTMSVREHLAFGLRLRKRPTRQINARVAELAQMLAISHLLERRPANLSGGESQRVALGRALAPNPSILLLDEPLSALDHQTRADILRILHSFRGHHEMTTLHITHNLEETRALADLLFTMDGGRLAPAPHDAQWQSQTPTTLWSAR